MLEVRIYHKDSDEYIGSFPTDAYGNNFETIAGNTKPLNYLTFDGLGVNLLDDNLKFYENDDYMGYILPYISGETQNNLYQYSIEQSTPLTFDFSTVSQKPQNITVISKDCIGSFEYQTTWQNSSVTLSSTRTILAHNQNNLTINLPENVVEVKLWILSSCVPNNFIKIESVFYGTINVFNKFKNHNLLEEINVLSDDLPINQFEATIVNSDPDNIVFAKKDPLVIFSNNKYYGSFYITNIQRSAKYLFDITAQNCIQLLESNEYNFWHLSSNFFIKGTVGGLIYKIKTITGVEINPPSINPEYYVFEGDLKHPSCRMVLCAVGFASGHMIDSSRNNNVSMIKIPNEISSTIKTADRRIIGDAVLKRSDEISDATIKYTRHAFGSFAIDKTVTVDVVGGQTFVYTFDNPVHVSTNIPNCEFIYSNLYSVCFIPNEGIASATITYGELKTAETIETVTNENSSIKNSKVFDKLKIKGFYNEQAGAYEESYVSRAADVKKYITSRGTVTAKIRLRNERCGDLIQIETAWDGIVTGIITKMNITFGYEDIADIEVLEWSL